ncbi:MAG: bifunctional adenosylcobinamide kinase/adenosylcobinamide-phosphate guanylyltransferase [Candidatus Omnitrophica bacterium]|nr:bifunctional adenosylcobinamide kinase/adenosylcobinamide-phosphate guanylyltransferase [Candidatus Omnitrophota bacterium]
MNKIILILGGARSGKSAQALSLAKGKKKVAFIATGQGLDKEMRERILKHQASRPKNWKTFEEPKELADLMTKIGDSFDCIIIDCLTLLVSNLILSGKSQEQILKKIEDLVVVLKKKKAKVILVSNEVGLGIVPDNKLGRAFRDIAGRVNQTIAKEAGEVYFTISGLPLKIKGEK